MNATNKQTNDINRWESSLLISLHELLNICRYKCSPLDEVVLGSGRSNEQAMIDAMAAIAKLGDREISQNPMVALENLRNEAVGYLADLNRHGVDTTTLRGAIKQAEAVIAKAK